MHCGTPFWGYEGEEEAGRAAVHASYQAATAPEFYTRPPRNNRTRNLVITFLLLGGAVFAFTPIKRWLGSQPPKTIAPTMVTKNCNLSQSAIYDRYKQAVGLILHEYVYEISIDGSSPMAFTKDAAGNFIPYQGARLPIAINGTGFFADSMGLILTNRHVAAPWRSSKTDKQLLQRSIQARLPVNSTGQQALNWLKANWSKRTVSSDSLAADTSHVYSADSLHTPAKKPAINIWARTVYLGIALHNMPAQRNQFIPCKIRRSADSSGIDIAILQTEHLPRGVLPVDMQQAVVADDSLKPGTRAILIGYPLGMDLALVRGGIIKVQIQDGQLNKESDGLQVQYNIPSAHGASGSPVFNDCGRLIAINYAGYDEVQGFNFGILARHAVKLINELKHSAPSPPIVQNPGTR
jgi:S1-C subfamily serine protease